VRDEIRDTKREISKMVSEKWLNLYEGDDGKVDESK